MNDIFVRKADIKVVIRVGGCHCAGCWPVLLTYRQSNIFLKVYIYGDVEEVDRMVIRKSRYVHARLMPRFG
jgi:hypothetical protein